MHYLKSSLNIDEIIKNFNNDSYVIIKNYFTEEEIINLQKYIKQDILKRPKGYKGTAGNDSFKDTPFEFIETKNKIINILEDIREKHFSIKSPNKEIYKVLRINTGINESVNKPFMFHYDAYVISALIPLIIPNREDGLNGKFIISGRKRFFHKNFFLNLFEKALIQNPLTRMILKIKFIQIIFDVQFINLIPGNLYLFNGYQSMHTVSKMGKDSLRATFLCHYSDPFYKNKFMKFLENINKYRIINRTKL